MLDVLTRAALSVNECVDPKGIMIWHFTVVLVLDLSIASSATTSIHTVAIDDSNLYGHNRKREVRECAFTKTILLYLSI